MCLAGTDARREYRPGPSLSAGEDLEVLAQELEHPGGLERQDDARAGAPTPGRRADHQNVAQDHGRHQGVQAGVQGLRVWQQVNQRQAG